MRGVWFISWQGGALWVALLSALLLSMMLVATKHRHGHLTLDSEVGVQKFHAEPTPRVGGVSIYLALLLAWTLVHDADVSQILGVILVAGIPALAFGLLEDVTKRVGVLPKKLVFAAPAGRLVLRPHQFGQRRKDRHRARERGNWVG
jgi:UDP-N-acetylmuramyl pentapeptide phosphotransferase/UDP-N-acetylglucosamine-1-phosphate transferase